MRAKRVFFPLSCGFPSLVGGCKFQKFTNVVLGLTILQR